MFLSSKLSWRTPPSHPRQGKARQGKGKGKARQGKARQGKGARVRPSICAALRRAAPGGVAMPRSLGAVLPQLAFPAVTCRTRCCHALDCICSAEAAFPHHAPGERPYARSRRCPFVPPRSFVSHFQKCPPSLALGFGERTSFCPLKGEVTTHAEFF